MKKIYSFLLFMCLIIQNSSFAQYERAEQAIKSAPYIFEGKVVALDFIQDKQANYFVSYKVEVLKSLKGGKYLKEKDTVELVSEMPTGWYIFENGEFGSAPLQGMPPSLQKGWALHLRTHGVFMVNNNLTGISDNQASKSFIPSLAPTVDSYFNIRPYFIRKDVATGVTYHSYNPSGFGLTFSSLEEFNVFLQKMNLPSLIISPKKKDVQAVKKDSINALKYSNRLAKSLENDQLLNNRKTNFNYINPKTVQNCMLG